MTRRDGWRGLLALTAVLLVSCAPYGLPRAGEEVYRNVVFASPGGQRLRLDLYVPKTPQLAPVVIWIFGGSWRYGSKEYHVNLRDLTRSGLAVAAVEYRLSGSAKYPAQLQDTRSAMAWLRANGAKYHIDGERIGLSGESAGGHLAALAGVVEGKSKVRAVCALYPPTDLITLGRQYANQKQPSDIERLLGGRIEEKIDLARAASPVGHVTHDSPPFLMIHGASDTLVPISQSEELDQRLRAAGVESRIITVPEKGHWFLLNRAQVAEVAAFFQRHFR